MNGFFTARAARLIDESDAALYELFARFKCSLEFCGFEVDLRPSVAGVMDQVCLGILCASFSCVHGNLI